MSLCQFRDALGKPHQGIHAARFEGLARNDLVLTAIAALIIAAIYVYNKRGTKNAIVRFIGVSILAFFILWGIGISLHLLFCVNTPVTEELLKIFHRNSKR